MISRKTSLRAAVLLLGLIVIGGTSPAVSAVEDTTGSQGPTSTTSDQRISKEQQQRQAALAKKAQELKEKRIRQCAAKSEGINTSLSKITENRRQVFNRLTEVSDKTQAFVINKQLVVKDYSKLVALVNTRKSAAEASIAQMAAVNTLDCNAVRTPKDQLQTFHKKRKTTHDAIDEYRRAVKRMILAVKTSVASHKGLEGKHRGSGDQKTQPTGDTR